MNVIRQRYKVDTRLRGQSEEMKAQYEGMKLAVREGEINFIHMNERHILQYALLAEKYDELCPKECDQKILRSIQLRSRQDLKKWLVIDVKEKLQKKFKEEDKGIFGGWFKGITFFGKVSKTLTEEDEEGESLITAKSKQQ